MNSNRKNRIICIFGRKGTGKSILLKAAVKNSRRLILIDPLNEYQNGRVIYDKQALLDYIEPAQTFRAVYRPIRREDQGDPLDFAVNLAILKGDCTLAIDEVDQYTSSYYLSDALYWAVHYGRHYGVSLVLASRQANRIRPDITAQADTILTFQTQGGPLDYLAEFADQDVDSVQNLADHNFQAILGNIDDIADLP